MLLKCQRRWQGWEKKDQPVFPGQMDHCSDIYLGDIELAHTESTRRPPLSHSYVYGARSMIDFPASDRATTLGAHEEAVDKERGAHSVTSCGDGRQ